MTVTSFHQSSLEIYPDVLKPLYCGFLGCQMDFSSNKDDGKAYYHGSAPQKKISRHKLLDGSFRIGSTNHGGTMYYATSNTIMRVTKGTNKLTPGQASLQVNERTE
jgi:hypothetical protein